MPIITGKTLKFRAGGRAFLFVLTLGLIPAIARTEPFDRLLRWDGIGFRVQCPNDKSLNTLTVQPSGLSLPQANIPIHQEIDGGVSDAQLVDLDGNGSPELYVFISGYGSGGYGELLAWNVNNGRSLSEIYLPPLSDDPVSSKGYMGHDVFYTAGNRLIRKFPVYRSSDSNANPTGGMRVLRYHLVAGEAGWILRSDNGCD